MMALEQSRRDLCTDASLGIFWSLPPWLRKSASQTKIVHMMGVCCLACGTVSWLQGGSSRELKRSGVIQVSQAPKHTVRPENGHFLDVNWKKYPMVVLYQKKLSRKSTNQRWGKRTTSRQKAVRSVAFIKKALLPQAAITILLK